jgi:hypothetical protein
VYVSLSLSSTFLIKDHVKNYKSVDLLQKIINSHGLLENCIFCSKVKLYKCELLLIHTATNYLAKHRCLAKSHYLLLALCRCIKHAQCKKFSQRHTKAGAFFAPARAITQLRCNAARAVLCKYALQQRRKSGCFPPHCQLMARTKSLRWR